MKIEALVGEYNIIGHNQNDSEESYKGVLYLSLDENKNIVAEWLINNSQKQFGNGFYKDNILVINFWYIGFKDKTYTGTVVYKCLNNDILKGFWSEKYGNPIFLGTENCFRVQSLNFYA